MVKYLLKTILFLLVGMISFAQSKEERKYNEKALEVQDLIWNSNEKAFEVKEIPEKYKNESAVIIARSVEVANSTRRKFVVTRTVKQYKFYTTLRERILIKDKSALEEYSTLNYKKLSDNTVNYSFYKLVNSSTTYIGIKVLKSNGKVIIINPGEEEVLTKNKSNEKDGKIAVPDLQVGDIMDYYIHVEEVIEDYSRTMGPHVYFLADNYPILNYHVKYTLDRKSGADIISLNGAGKIEESTNEDRDIILEFTEKDLPRINNTLWMAKARQVPLYVVRYGFEGSSVYAKPGEVKKGPYLDILKDKLTQLFVSLNQYKSYYPKAAFDEHLGGRKKILQIPADSAINYLYNHYKLSLYGWLKSGRFLQLEVSNKRNYDDMDWFNSAVSFCEVLRGYDIKGDIVVVPNRFSGHLDQAFLLGDFETFVRINMNGVSKWYCFNSFFEDAGRLSSVYEGQDALIFSRELKGMTARFKNTGEIFTLPVSKSSENILSENLNVSFNKTNIQLISIDRTVNASGNMKQNEQKQLLLAEQVESSLSKITSRQTTIEYLAENKKTAAQSEELKTAFAKESLNQKDYFKAEIKSQFDQEPKELLSYKINNTGLSHYAPAFEYDATFTMDNFVKKAGNNFIFDAGRLMGTYKRLDEKESKRSLDVYMPSARQLNYKFSIMIPEGYTVKGIEELNKKEENDIASFVSTAKLNGNTVQITVNRTYNNNFEPAANWPKLVSVINAAADFTNMKLLLEKKQ